MNYAELIAEAEKAPVGLRARGYVWEAECIDRLAAALRELAPPEGWGITEYSTKHGAVTGGNGVWWVMGGDVGDDGACSDYPNPFPTASAAMAALDGERK